MLANEGAERGDRKTLAVLPLVVAHDAGAVGIEPNSECGLAMHHCKNRIDFNLLLGLLADGVSAKPRIRHRPSASATDQQGNKSWMANNLPSSVAVRIDVW
jgi:hypothetical protein